MDSEKEQLIPKEFLENLLGKKVESFSLNLRPDTGDNFMSILYTLDVEVISDDKGNDKNSNKETLHFISKCYPSNTGRQDYLNSTGLFWKELDFYKVWIPQLLQFTKELGLKDTVKLNLPTLIAGDATNGSGKEENTKEGMKLTGPFENYVMMVDLCKTYGYKLADRHVRLDKDHLVLVMEALAKIHALSWAYKTNKKIDVIKEKFPSLVFDYPAGRSAYETAMTSTINEAIQTLKSNAETDSKVLSALLNFKEPCNKILEALYGESTEPEQDIEKYFRVKPKETPEALEIPWRVVIHGDCQVTNMLFRYNSETNKPEEVILVDMQLSREASPLMDLVYFMYTSTYLETRQNHSEEMIELYYEKFNHFCKMFKTETLPGFTLKELKRRYQRSKIFGLVIAILSGTIMLQEKEDSVQMDSLEGLSQEEILLSMMTGMNTSTRYSKFIGSLIKEFYDEGII